MLKTLHISVKLKHANSQEEVNKSFSQNMCAPAKPHKKWPNISLTLVKPGSIVKENPQ